MQTEYAQSVRKEVKSVELSVAFGRFFELYGGLQDDSVCFLIRIDKHRNTQKRIHCWHLSIAIKNERASADALTGVG